MKTLKLFYLLLATATVMTFTSCSDDDKDQVEPNLTVIDFEDITLPAEGYVNNYQYTSKGVAFYNKFSTWDGGFTSWEGFVYSKLTDKTTQGIANEYSVYGDGGANKSEKFAIAYPAFDTLTNFRFAAGKAYLVKNIMINNSTFAALGVKNGTDFSKEFEAGDWFKVIFTGYDTAEKAGKSVEFYLADYRNGKSYICSQWTLVDLSTLGKIHSIAITFASSDSGADGINNPQYICLDNLAYIAE